MSKVQDRKKGSVCRLLCPDTAWRQLCWYVVLFQAALHRATYFGMMSGSGLAFIVEVMDLVKPWSAGFLLKKLVLTSKAMFVLLLDRDTLSAVETAESLYS